MLGPDLPHRFPNHAPLGSPYRKLATRYGKLARELDELLADGRDKALALTHLEESLLWATRRQFDAAAWEHTHRERRDG